MAFFLSLDALRHHHVLRIFFLLLFSIEVDAFIQFATVSCRAGKKMAKEQKSQLFPTTSEKKTQR